MIYDNFGPYLYISENYYSMNSPNGLSIIEAE
jgi:hypothetical protein